MKTISVQHVMFPLLPMLLLFQFSILVAAVDISFYNSKTSCRTGSFVSCLNVNADQCCGKDTVVGNSVLVSKTSGSSTKSFFYRNGGCTTQVGHASGEFCLTGTPTGKFTGAKWHQARRRSLLTDSKQCNDVMVPNTVGYTEAGTRGRWLLTSSNATEIYLQFENLSDAEQVNWLQSHGATYNN